MEVMMNSFLERDLGFAEERGFTIEETTHEKFGDGYLVTVEPAKARNFGEDHFQGAIPLFSLDAFLYFLPKNKPESGTTSVAFEPYGTFVVFWPSSRAFNKNGVELHSGRGATDSFIFLSGFSPRTSEYWLKVNYNLPCLGYRRVGSIWICVEGKDLAEKGISPRQALLQALHQEISLAADPRLSPSDTLGLPASPQD
jgi:hypothetical protein